MNFNLKFLKLLAIFSIVSINVINCIIVKTKSGSINGLSTNFNNKVINKFVGIPYAEPPVGSNRFGKTKPVQQWNNTYDATHIRNICYQSPAKPDMSEDCLYLNIYSEERQSGSNTLVPVLFWIHGGGFNTGEGYSFDGTVYASKGFVFVSINYRLGPFGFLYGGDQSAPGNVGILDQIMALHWVKDNIEYFGGDSKQVTIFGYSAGSWSVSTLLVTPLAKDLFKRAIMHSGAFFIKPLINSDKSTHLNHSKIMSESLGCNKDNKWLDCMRNVSAEQILSHNVVEAALTYADDAGVLPNGIEEALKLKKVNTGHELIAGVTRNDGVVFAVILYPKINNLSIHITKAELKDFLNSHIWTSKFGQTIYDYYISNIDEKNQIAIRQAFSNIYTDLVILCPTYYFAKEYAKASDSDKTYFYETTYKSKYTICPAEWMGVCHTDDVPFIYGTPISNKSLYNQTDYEFSLIFTQIISDFAKTGNPLSNPITNTLGTQVNSWPTLTDQKTTTATKVMELNPFRFGTVMNNPFQNNCDVMLKPYFY